MDTITQIQVYVSTISQMFGNDIDRLMHSPGISVAAAQSQDPKVIFEPGYAELLDQKAEEVFKRIVEVDMIVAALPPSYDEEHQLRVLQELEEENRRAGERLAAAQEQVLVWQKRVSAVLKQSASHQLNSN